MNNSYKYPFKVLMADIKNSVFNGVFFAFKILCSVFCPIYVFVECIKLGVNNSIVSGFFKNFVYRYPRMFKSYFWYFWFPQSDYYQYKRNCGGYGKARWFWRRPNKLKWKRCTDWWVFTG